jgi:hypothetical protein
LGAHEEGVMTEEEMGKKEGMLFMKNKNLNDIVEINFQIMFAGEEIEALEKRGESSIRSKARWEYLVLAKQQLLGN